MNRFIHNIPVVIFRESAKGKPSEEAALNSVREAVQEESTISNGTNKV